MKVRTTTAELLGIGERRASGIVAKPRPVTCKVLAQLAQGGMAEILLAVAGAESASPTLVVIKRPRRSLVHEDGFREMFNDEARLASMLRHPHLIETYGVGLRSERQFIAMQYLEGQSLRAILTGSSPQRRPRFDLACALKTVECALDGLAFAHELRQVDGTPLGVVHRDICPQNLFITYSGEVKLCDFGVAKAHSNTSETQVGVLKGRFRYMSPEQARAESLDRRSDVFAMGIVLWELLAGRSMFHGQLTVSALYNLMAGTIAPITALVPDVDPALAQIVGRALRVNRDERFADAGEMRDAIRGYIHGHDLALSAGELGARVSAMFAEERDAKRRDIDALLAAARRARCDESGMQRACSLSGSSSA